LDTVQKKHQELEKKEEKQKEQLENQPLDVNYGMMPGLGQQMLMPQQSFPQQPQGMF